MNESDTARQPAVMVTRHARARALRDGLSETEAVAEVAAALQAGRIASERPRFLGAGPAPSRGRRFAWPESRRRAYVIDVDDAGHVVVVTLISAASAETAVAQAFRRAGIGPDVEVKT